MVEKPYRVQRVVANAIGQPFTMFLHQQAEQGFRWQRLVLTRSPYETGAISTFNNERHRRYIRLKSVMKLPRGSMKKLLHIK
jgi:hypothetical protein